MIVFHTINIAICHRVGEYKDAFDRGRLLAALFAEKFQNCQRILPLHQEGIK
jgi:hypothetical protein